MRVLDLFAGTGSSTNSFLDRGHEVIHIEMDERFKPEYCCDVMDFEYKKLFGVDVIWASPPCTAFSVASIGTHWFPNKKPKSDFCKTSLRLIEKTLEIINYFDCIYFIENPVGMLRKMNQMKSYPRKTVTYCQYGDVRMKPTDIWTNCITWFPKLMCKNSDPCHEKAPRGLKNGTQGIKSATERALVPYNLSLEICIACENQLNNKGKRQLKLGVD